MELNRTVAVAVLLRRPAGGVGTRVRLHGTFGRTRERQLLFRPLGCTTSCGRPRPEWPRAAERGRPTPRSLRLSASVEDQVGERRRRAVGFIIASSAPSLQPAFNIFLPWPWLTQPGGSLLLDRSRSRPARSAVRSAWIQADRVLQSSVCAICFRKCGRNRQHVRGFLSSREVHIYYVRMVEGTRTGPIKPAALFRFPRSHQAGGTVPVPQCPASPS